MILKGGNKAVLGAELAEFEYIWSRLTSRTHILLTLLCELDVALRFFFWWERWGVVLMRFCCLVIILLCIYCKVSVLAGY